MKIYSKIILIHLKLYGKLDYFLLEEELHISRVYIGDLVKDLYDSGIIRSNGEELYINPEYKDELVEDTSWYSPRLKERRISSFEWNYLYIPKRFNIMN